MKLLILSSDPSITQWKSLSIKLNQIATALNTGKNSNFTVELRQITTRPLVDVITGRINRDWLDNLAIPYYKQGYDIVGFHFNSKQYLEWNIKPKLGGSNPRSTVVAESMYWWSDETSKRKGIGKFVETCLHEICHGYYQKTGLTDQTHATDAAMGTVVSLLPTFDWSVYQKTQIKRLEAIVAALRALLVKKKPSGLQHPVNDLLPAVKRGVDKVLYDMKMLGFEMRMTEGYRSSKRQSELYALGRTTPGRIVTNAKAGESLHNHGVAADFVFRKQGYDATKDQWLAFASVAESHGFEWGGNWNEFIDRPHIQMMKGYKLKDFQKGLVDYNKYK